ncbi:hypothetical protein CPB84DRAFT_1747940 [Gymnopilus junonius]|uniref:Uncharacterized protein n=1 Tax=Gymnopilus junonius TaxID=109634 RepID=A0A9P5NPD1_GYMJU|nr:hypothetical protein CPB84DRAFT_1751225 [Gymnopilus junonius]KAF8898276.1 hypothetical protein CPB84DRAFT_1747940 [Gymnopilus junonius]
MSGEASAKVYKILWSVILTSFSRRRGEDSLGQSTGQDRSLQWKRYYVSENKEHGDKISDTRQEPFEESQSYIGSKRSYGIAGIRVGQEKSSSKRAHSTGVQHTINLFFTDSILFIYYYDRQATIQSRETDIFHESLRFVILLLAFQRLSIENWGIILALNPEAIDELYGLVYKPEKMVVLGTH